MIKKFLLLTLLVLAGLSFYFHHGVQAAGTATITANGQSGIVWVPLWSQPTIAWTSDASTCDVFIGTNQGHGSEPWSSGHPSYTATSPPIGADTVFFLVCYTSPDFANPSSSDEVTVRPLPAPTASIIVNGSHDVTTSVPSGTAVEVTWSSNATYCQVHRGDATNDGPIAWEGANGDVSTPITSYTRFRLYCQGPNGSAFDQASVDVSAPPAVVTHISCDPGTVAYGGSSNISWSSSYASSCTVSPGGWSGISGGPNSTGTLYSSTTYTISCSR